MICPKCGNQKAILLLTSFECPTMSCANYSQELACDIWSAGIKNMTQQGTTIGRFSSKAPNYSNIPKKQPWEGFFKKAYIAHLHEKGRTIKSLSKTSGLSYGAICQILQEFNH